MMKLRLIAISAAFVAFLAVVAGDVAEAETNGEELQPVSEPPIKLLHVLNPGEREYLSPNLIGVQNIAMTFLPLSMNFVNVIDAFREIVNGVRYEILLNAVDTKNKDAEVICRLVILEKPWLRTEWGDKVRELQNSNCTRDADNLTDPLARSNAINDKYVEATVFNGGSRNELTASEMSNLEAQIMPSFSAPKHVTTNNAAAPPTTSTSTTTTTESPKIVPEYGGEDTAATTEPPELSDTEKRWLDNVFTQGALNFEISHGGQNEPEAAPNTGGSADDDYLQQNVVNESGNIENYQQPEQEAAPQSDSESADSEQAESNHERAKRGYSFVGGESKLDNEEAEESLRQSLAKLAAGDGPTYKLSKIYSATVQVVSGSLKRIEADLINADGETERCEVSIWSRPWLKEDGYEVTFKCPNKKVTKHRHSRSVEYAEKKTHKKHNHHNLEKAEHLFNKFQIKYKRRYHNTVEHQMRLRIFRENLRTIQELNRNEKGSAKYGITEFADMTTSEYKLRTGLWQRDANKPSGNSKADIPNVVLPKEFDWREKGAVSPVKNQGSCGSCWAFSVTGNIEGLHAIKTGKLEEYSEQELLDCDTIDSACSGGLPDNAYKAIQTIGGLETEGDYPYAGRQQQCHWNKTKPHITVKDAVDLPKNETAMMQWLLKNGPISIGINANAMQFYRGGVSHPWHPLCSKKNLDHGVLIVGYGVSEYPSFKKTLPYWIVKNSWGPKWGEQGYYRVYRGDNTCGVSEMASSAVLAD